MIPLARLRSGRASINRPSPGNLRGLEREGLIEIAIVEEDLRRRAVRLTEKGARTLEAAIPVWRRANAALARLMKASFCAAAGRCDGAANRPIC